MTDILEAAGYTDIQLDRYDAKVMVGRTIDDAIDFQLALGPCGEIVREAGELGESKSSRRRRAAHAHRPFTDTERCDDGVELVGGQRANSDVKITSCLVESQRTAPPAPEASRSRS